MTQPLLRAFLASCLAVVAIGCSGDDGDPNVELRCADEARGETYVAGMEAAGKDGIFRVALLDAVPAPPDKGDNDWLIEVRDSAGTPVADPNVIVTPFMPDHGHGTGVVPTVTPGTSTGQFSVERVNLWMPGLWEVRIDVTTADDTDRSVFSFCVEG